MFLSRSPTFRFWLYVYSFPAMLPIFMNVAFIYLVRNDVVKALGPDGSIVASKISMALSVVFILMVVLANAIALWHKATGKPAIPGPADPPDLVAGA